MKPIFVSTLLATATIAAAQTPASSRHEADPLHLDNFEVTTHPYARNETEIAQPTAVLVGAKLDLRQALNLGDLVSQEPGVSSSYFGPGASRPVIRGMSGPRVAVLQNGSDMIDASTISPDHAVSLDPLLIERIEITRGPAALLQGGSAIGGAVNVVTHRIHETLPPEGVHGRIEGRSGSVDDEISSGIVLEGAVDQLAWHVDSFYRETEDIRIPGFAESKYLRRLEALEEAAEHHDEDEHDDHEDEEHEDDHEHEHDEDEEAFGTLPNTFVKTQGGSLGLSWITDNGYLGASFSMFDSNYGIPPGAHSHEHGHEEDHEEDEHHDEHEDEEHHDEDEHDDEHGEEEELISIDLKQRRFELKGELRDPVAGWQAIRWQAAFADYEHTELEGDEVGTVFTNEGYDIRIDALHQPWGEWQGALGFEWSLSDFNAVGEEAFVPPTETDILSFMIFEELEKGPNIFQLGGRIDSQSIEVTDGTRREADGIGWATSFGVVHTASEVWSISTSLSVTERLPISQELFADGPHIGTNAYEVGNSTLDNEQSMGIDVSLRKSGERFSGSVTAFANDFDGYIYENPTGEEEDGLPVYAFTQRDARFHGIEAAGMLHLWETDQGHLDWTFGMDFVEAKNRTDDTYLPRISPWRWRTGLDWQHGPLRIGTEITFNEGQDHLAPDELPTDAYELWSAYASYRFITGGTTWDLLLRGSNLTDSEARLHTSFLKDVAPLPGRNITVSLRMSF